MLSKNKARFILSLQRKKERDEEGLFVIEGDKIVREFLQAGVKLKMLVAKPEFIRSIPAAERELAGEIEETSYDELKRVSTLKTPHNALALVPATERKLEPEKLNGVLSCALAFIQDPGNLGTIIRAAGWFGIRSIICSPDCVDVYNPKVIQASMGAILHVNVFYENLEEVLAGANSRGLPVFGTMLGGDSIYEHSLGNSGIILLGNESKGIPIPLHAHVNHRISIPSFSPARPGIDSLNVGMAASIVFSEFRRRAGSS